MPFARTTHDPPTVIGRSDPGGPTGSRTQRLSAMRILVADASGTDLDALEELLGGAGYTEVTGTREGETIPGLCSTWAPDLVILDLHLPGLPGCQALGAIRHLLDEPEMLPVLVTTSEMGLELRHRALSLGARDVLPKPIDEASLLLRVRHLLHERLMECELRSANQRLESAVSERTQELLDSRNESLLVLAHAAEFRDDETGRHARRVGRTAGLIAVAMGMSPEEAAVIRDAAPLHDLGKIGISDGVLGKPGPLTDEERQAMMRHVDIGARILEGTTSPVLQVAREIASYHHERWDGSGYLAGLSGEQIPLSARITAVADVFDALTHSRPYKPAWEIDRGRAEIRQQAGRAFDPAVVDAFRTLDALGLIADVTPGSPSHPAFDSCT